jgi:hypothetical protein
MRLNQYENIRIMKISKNESLRKWGAREKGGMRRKVLS